MIEVRMTFINLNDLKVMSELTGISRYISCDKRKENQAFKLRVVYSSNLQSKLKHILFDRLVLFS